VLPVASRSAFHSCGRLLRSHHVHDSNRQDCGTVRKETSAASIRPDATGLRRPVRQYAHSSVKQGGLPAPAEFSVGKRRNRYGIHRFTRVFVRAAAEWARTGRTPSNPHFRPTPIQSRPRTDGTTENRLRLDSIGGRQARRRACCRGRRM